MSSFNKSQSKKASILNNTKVKKHVKSFYEILNLLNDVSEKLKDVKDINEENINEHALPFMGRDLDVMEQSFILNKLNNVETQNNN